MTMMRVLYKSLPMNICIGFKFLSFIESVSTLKTILWIFSMSVSLRCRPLVLAICKMFYKVDMVVIIENNSLNQLSIPSMFYEGIFCTKFWCQKISNPKHSFVIFGTKISYEKHGHKKLMKLTPGVEARS